jgi:hypothetical protein
MSIEETDLDTSATARRRWWIAGAVVAGVLVLALVFNLRPRSRPPATNRDTTVTRTEDGVEVARQALAGSGEARIVRSALTQINTAIGKGIDNPPPSLKPDEAAVLRDLCGLGQGDLDEITGNTYSLLDGPHIEYCLLLRDAARSLEGRLAGLQTANTPEGRARVRLDAARLAFEWVMRQVRLQPGLKSQPGGWATPDLILRRGLGDPLDRGVIFLDLLRHFGSLQGSMPEIVGALLFFPASKDQRLFWACGVDVGDGRGLYVFDPALGLPIPGPGGKSIATLGETASDPKVLAQLQVDGAPKYGVTMEQAATAEAALHCTLSALSPRMRQLQDVFLPPTVEVRLGVDVEQELERLRKAAGAGGKKTPVQVWKQGVLISRQFHMPAEGGLGQPMRIALRDLPGFTLTTDPTTAILPLEQIYRYAVVPWLYMPVLFRDPVEFPYQSGLGNAIRDRFARPFQEAIFTAGARDLRLRGRTREAVPLLVGERDHWLPVRQQLEAAAPRELVEQIAQWKAKAVIAYAHGVSAPTSDKEEAVREIVEVWKEAGPVLVLLLGSVAEARIGDITYEVALCKHEEAERMQARLDLIEKDSKPEDADRRKTATAWREAVSAWDTFLRDYKNRPDAIAARQWRGRAHARLGDWKAAVEDWKDTSGPLPDIVKLANFYHASLPPEQYR